MLARMIFRCSCTCSTREGQLIHAKYYVFYIHLHYILFICLYIITKKVFKFKITLKMQGISFLLAWITSDSRTELTSNSSSLMSTTWDTKTLGRALRSATKRYFFKKQACVMRLNKGGVQKWVFYSHSFLQLFGSLCPVLRFVLLTAEERAPRANRAHWGPKTTHFRNHQASRLPDTYLQSTH